MRLLFVSIFFIGAFLKVSAQDSLFDDPNVPIPSKEYRPSLGFGLGHYSYYGDVKSSDSRSNYAGSIAYSFYAARRINDYFDLGLRFSAGDLYGNETGPESYLNFKTSIHYGSAYVAYNFSNFLPKNKILKPYLSLGFSAFEFNNKGDLFDANGNRYYYWSDGLIRNLDENSVQAAQAVRIQRDYNYETDLRKANLDGLDRYKQVGFAIPIGLELEFNVTERFSFRIGSIINLSFTNLMDNISEDGTGARQGKSGNDHFLQNTISGHYDLFGKRKKITPESFVFPDYFAMDVNDNDKDGVINEFDICPFTIKDVIVDKNGCPFDVDLDGVPDFYDREIETPLTVNVNKDGVSLTDDDYLFWYLTYMDSLNVSADVLARMSARKVLPAIYRVFLKETEPEQILSDSLFNVFNSQEDLKAFTIKGNKTIFTVGEYGSIADAEERKHKLEQKGFIDPQIIVLDDNKMILGDHWEKIADEIMRDKFKEDYAKLDAMEGFYAVQLGSTPAGSNAFEKAKYLSNSDVLPIPGQKNSINYVVGPYIDTVSASQNVQNYVSKGFKDAKVMKIFNGKVLELNASIPKESVVKLRSLDSLNDFNKLKTLDGKLVVKIGTITKNTSKEQSDRLYNDPKAILVANPDNSIDFIYPIGYNNMEDVESKKQEYLKKGFPNPVIVSVLFEEDHLKLIYREELDTKYTISLGSFKNSVTTKEEEKILSIPDVRSVQTYDPNAHHYTVGVFDKKEDSKARMLDLYKQGYQPEVVKYEGGKFIPIDVRDLFNDQELSSIKEYKLNPIVNTNEVVFRVQVGAYKKLISENQFRSSAVITFLNEGGVYKYMTDGAPNYKDAYIKKLKMQELGFPDAFVVAHKDGKKIAVKDLVNVDEFKKIKAEFGSNPVNVNSQIVYKVQLGAFKDMQGQEKFSQFENVEIEIYGDYKRFLTGGFSTYDEASLLKSIAKSKGFVNAFVVAYNKGERMSAPSHNPNVIQTNEGVGKGNSGQDLKKLNIMVQIGVFNGELPPEVVKQFEAIPKITIQITPEGIIRYMAGDFKDPSEATAYKEELLSKGFEGVFLVAFYNSEKIDIQEAVEIFNKSK